MKLRYIISCLTFVLISFLLWPRGAEASRLFVVPAEQAVPLGDTFVVELRMDSEQEVINAMAGLVTYTPDTLEIVDVSIGGSLFTLWVIEPTVDSLAGTISFVGGIPQGSYVIDGKIFTITFRARSPGLGRIDFQTSDTSVHRNDPTGSLTPLQTQSALYEVGKIDSLTLPISSETHPDQTTWYRETAGQVSWQPRQDALYNYIVSQNQFAEPKDRSNEVVGEVTLTDLPDGINYFILKEKLPFDDWQIVGRYRLLIDTTPPLPFTPIVSRSDSLAGGEYVLNFSTIDVGSGVIGFDLKEGKNLTTNVTSPFRLQDQTLSSSVIITAYDKAGNRQSAGIGVGNINSKQFSIRDILKIVGLILGTLLVVFIATIIGRKNNKRQHA